MEATDSKPRLLLVMLSVTKVDYLLCMLVLFSKMLGSLVEA